MAEIATPVGNNGKEVKGPASPPEKPALPPPDHGSWQRGLLPFIKGCLLLFTLFFVGASTFQLFDLNNKIYYHDKNNISETFQLMIKGEQVDRLKAAQRATLTELESQAITRRYHQANVLMMSKIWIQYLSFITGMILAIIGAIFILGKFSELESAFDADLKTVGKVAFRSTSPGLIMAFFGTILIIFSLSVERPIAVTDDALYIGWDNKALSGSRSGIQPYDSIFSKNAARPTRDTTLSRPPRNGN